MIKKVMKDTVAVTVGGVGISQANTLGSPWGNVVGSTMGAGLAMNVGKYSSKKRRR